MQDVKAIVIQQAVAMWRRRWYAMAVAWLVCVVGWTAVAYLPNVYEAKARVYVDADSMLRPLLRGLAVDTNVFNEVDLMQRTLLSRPNLLKVARMADLDLGAASVAEQEGLVAQLEQRVRVTSSRSAANLFAITYQHSDPIKAKNVVQALITVFVENNLGESRKDMVAARTFIDDQISDYKQQLEKAERDVAEFKARNVGMMSGGNYFGRIEQLLDRARNDVTAVEGELSDARKRRDELKRQLADVPAMVTTGDAADELASRAAALEQQLSALVLRYTEQHPDVLETRRQLEAARLALQTERQNPTAQTQRFSRGRGAGAKVPNPIYERVKLQLVDEDTRIAALENKLERHRGEVIETEGRIRAMPGVGTELSRLTRDYEVIKRNYEELIGRREAAKMGQKMDAQARNVQFRLVDPPEVPSRPAGPNRTLFVSVIFVFGLGAGMFFAFFLAQIDSSVAHAGQLRGVANLPVLGVISRIRFPADRWRRTVEGMTYGAVCIALVGTYLTLLSVEVLMGRGA